jgi:hypothetical protein
MDTPGVRTRGNKAVSFMPDLMPRYNLIRLEKPIASQAVIAGSL